ncbi:hypothetical protein MMRN_p0100 (plasmid) [Mycobacterium marinum]|nr:hypothetical protein MMRN_p0100 [Mycobacterium marinum]
MTDLPDIEIGRCAVRTFNLVDERYCDLDDEQVVPFSGRILTSVYRPGGQWLTGACVARCGKGHAHEAPAEGCGCGIYGALSLKTLSAQFPSQASRLVAVIAAEGSDHYRRPGVADARRSGGGLLVHS